MLVFPIKAFRIMNLYGDVQEERDNRRIDEYEIEGDVDDENESSICDERCGRMRISKLCRIAI